MRKYPYRSWVLSVPLLLALGTNGSPPKLLAARPAFGQLASDNPTRTALDKAVDKAVGEFFQQDQHVGLSIGVSDDGEAAFYNYGTVSKSKVRLPDRKSVYEIASITKTFTGSLASRAVLDKKMTLDGDFRAYLPERYPNMEKNGKFITLRLLAAHRAGLPKNVPDTDALFKNPNFETLPFQLIELEEPYDDAAYLRALHQIELRTEPGSEFVYSNFGIKLLGFGLQQVYRQSFGLLLQTEILAPLGMKRTSLAVSPQNEPLLVQGYSPSGKPMPYHLLNAGAAGGLYSNAEDLVRYIDWQLDEGDPTIRQSHSAIYGNDETVQDGMIWYMTRKDGERKLWESGGAFGMASQLVLYPESKLGIVLLANDGGFSTQDELSDLAKKIHDARGHASAHD
jgi:D-alanyl-D-alanine-carboxypeptidase/D-alanyl-D-alanine-endopeptidase